MSDCLFCRIVRGEIPAVRVGENEHALAFLDIHPLADGHTLVTPKVHASRLEEVGPAHREGLWELVHRLLPRIESTVGADAMTVGVNDGPEAGQEVPHVHVHLVPRTGHDGHGPIHRLFGDGHPMALEGLQELAGRIRAAPDP